MEADSAAASGDSKSAKKRTRADLDEDDDYLVLSDSEVDTSTQMDVDTCTEDHKKPKVKRTAASEGSPGPKKKAKPASPPVPSVAADHPESYHAITEEDAKVMRSQLLAWYDENQRQMPWRIPSVAFMEKHGSKLKEGEYYDAKTSGFDQGYGALVSELMLQQTQVSTVRSYFVNWMKTFPTVEKLALASLEEVNAAWAGLGYYRRAKLLHECAKAIVKDAGGNIPRTSEELEKLPGLGRYTAGAIASVVFGQVTPIVDGNVIRVLTRFRAIGAEPKGQKVTKLLWALSATAVDPARPGDFNQALMELGALVCTKANPGCDKCPLSSQCHAYAQVKSSNKAIKKEVASSSDIEDLCSLCTNNDPTTAVTKYPIKGAKKAKKTLLTYVSVVRYRLPTQADNNEDFVYLVSKRPEGGLLGGFWEFPSLDVPNDDDDDESRPTEVDMNATNEYIKSKFGLDLTSFSQIQRKFLGSYEHKFTHIDQLVLIEKIDITTDEQPLILSNPTISWTATPDMPKIAMSKVSQVCLDKANQKGTPMPAKRTAKKAAPEKNQPSILSMFAKASSKK